MSQAEQLELFPMPLGMRPPRRLRTLGFRLDYLDKLRAENAGLGREIEQHAATLAAAVAEAKAHGHVIPAAYSCTIGIEDNRDAIADTARRIADAYAEIDRELGRVVERHLKRC